MLNAINWYQFLQVLLGKDAPLFSVKEDPENVFIEFNDLTTAETVRQQLTTMLQSTKDFFDHLPYKIDGVRLQAHTTVRSANIPPLNEDVSTATGIFQYLWNLFLGRNNALGESVGEVRVIFQNLFGAEVFDDAAVNLDVLFGNQAIIKDGTLFSKPIKGQGNAQAWISFMKQWILHFNDVDSETIRQAWRGVAPLPFPTDQLDTQLSESYSMSGIVQQCFGTQTTPDGVVVFFNYRKLYEYLFPPKLVVGETDNQKYQISFRKEHFLNHLDALRNDEVLFHLYREEDEVVHARPIFYTPKASVQKPRLYTFVLDCSGSMNNSLTLMKTELLKIIAKIRDHDSEARIRIVPFHSTVSSGDEFKITDEIKIKECIENLVSSGSTNLYGAARQELNTAFLRTAVENVAIILLTDGYETVNQYELKDVSKVALDYPDSKKPTLTIFGFKTSVDSKIGYDEEVLSEIATAYNGKFFDITKFRDFSNILLSLDEVSFEQLVKLVEVELNNRFYQYDVTLYRDGAPHVMPGIQVPFIDGEAEITIDGERKRIIITNPEQIVKLRLVDKVNDVINSARMIMADSSLEISIAENDLQRLINKLQTFTAHSQIEQQALKLTHDELKSYLQVLNQADTSPEKLASMRTVAKARAGVQVVETKQPDKIIYANGPFDGTPSLMEGVTIIYDAPGPREQQEASFGYRLAQWLSGTDRFEDAVADDLSVNKTSGVDIFYDANSEVSADALALADFTTSSTLDWVMSERPEVFFIGDNGTPYFKYSYGTYDARNFYQELGVLVLYGDAEICLLPNGRHNIIEITGPFSPFQHGIDTTKITRTCFVEPTVTEVVSDAAAKGGLLGFASGLGQVVERLLQAKTDLSKQTTKLLGQLVLPLAYFSMRVYEGSEITDYPSQAITTAAWDTMVFMLTRTALNGVATQLENLRDAMRTTENPHLRMANTANVAAKLVRLGTFAYPVGRNLQDACSLGAVFCKDTTGLIDSATCMVSAMPIGTVSNTLVSMGTAIAASTAAEAATVAAANQILKRI